VKRAIAFPLALLLLLPGSEPLQAGQPKTVSWREIPAFAGDRQIEIRGTAGGKWKGHVVSVSPEALTIVDRDKGQTAIPRAQVQTLRLKKRGKLWTTVGTVAGAALGIGLGAFVNAYANNEGDGAPGAVAAIVAVPTALGFLLGYAADGGRGITVTVVD
jgi:hypothetical protein